MAVDQVELLIPLQDHPRITRVGTEGAHPVRENEFGVIIVIDDLILVERCFKADTDINHIIDVVDTHPLHHLLEEQESPPSWCDDDFPAADRFGSVENNPCPGGTVKDVSNPPLKRNAYPPAHEPVHEPADELSAPVGSDMGLPDIEQRDTDSLCPPLVDLQVRFLFEDRVQIVLYPRQKPLCLIPGPVLDDKADRVGIILLAVVQQASRADLVPVDHENGR